MLNSELYLLSESFLFILHLKISVLIHLEIIDSQICISSQNLSVSHIYICLFPTAYQISLVGCILGISNSRPHCCSGKWDYFLISLSNLLLLVYMNIRDFCVLASCCCLIAKSCLIHGLQSTRLLGPWDFPGKNTGVGCHFLLQEIFLTQGSNPHLLHCRWILYHLATWETHLYPTT